MKTYIYVLKDPETQEVRYVGKTVYLKTRYNQHIYIKKLKQRKLTHLSNWIIKLDNKGLKPIMEVIEETEKDNWAELEKKWISYYSNLTNSTSGGEGILGFKHSEETKKIMSENKKGKCTTSDYQRAILSKVHTGRIFSLESKQKMSGKRGKNCRSQKIKCLEDDLIFESVDEAANYYNVLRGSIYNILSGKAKKLRNNKTFIYV